MGFKSVLGKHVGGLAGAALGILGGPAGMATGYKIGSELGGAAGQDSEERRAYKQQREAAYNDWVLQNEYNSPAAQMERYREAGLNPNLVAGSLGSTTAGSVGSTGRITTHQPDATDLVNSYYDLRQKDAMTQNLHAQTDTTYKNNLINKAKLGMERERLNADLINANNRAHLDGMQYGILNNQLKMSQNSLRQSQLDLMDREYMRPYELQAMRRDLKYKGSGYNLLMRRVGDFVNALSPFVSAGAQAGASHFSWHRD